MLYVLLSVAILLLVLVVIFTLDPKRVKALNKKLESFGKIYDFYAALLFEAFIIAISSACMGLLILPLVAMGMLIYTGFWSTESQDALYSELFESKHSQTFIYLSIFGVLLNIFLMNLIVPFRLSGFPAFEKLKHKWESRVKSNITLKFFFLNIAIDETRFFDPVQAKVNRKKRWKSFRRWESKKCLYERSKFK